MYLNLDAVLSVRRWSYYKLAKHLDVHPETVYGWKQGKNLPRWEHLDAMCYVLQCAIDDLLIPDKPNLPNHSNPHYQSPPVGPAQPILPHPTTFRSTMPERPIYGKRIHGRGSASQKPEGTRYEAPLLPQEDKFFSR